jgi:hypothetical protein
MIPLVLQHTMAWRVRIHFPPFDRVQSALHTMPLYVLHLWTMPLPPDSLPHVPALNTRVRHITVDTLPHCALMLLPPPSMICQLRMGVTVVRILPLGSVSVYGLWRSIQALRTTTVLGFNKIFPVSAQHPY